MTAQDDCAVPIVDLLSVGYVPTITSTIVDSQHPAEMYSIYIYPNVESEDDVPYRMHPSREGIKEHVHCSKFRVLSRPSSEMFGDARKFSIPPVLLPPLSLPVLVP